MENLKLLGAIVGLLANIPLFLGILKGAIKQNFSTWMLWTFLDIITTVALIRQHGNYYLSGGYVFSSFSMSLLLFLKKEIEWNLIDTLTTISVITCLIIWYFMGDKATTVAGTSAVMISSFPLIKDTFYHPIASTTKIYFIFCIASFLSLIGGTSWSIEQSLYPAATLGFSALLTVLSMRKTKPIQAGV